MHVTNLQLTNFRGFSNLLLNLDRPVTVIVGTNGSGKSSVLNGLAQAYLTFANGGVGPRSPRTYDHTGHYTRLEDIRIGSDRCEISAIFCVGEAAVTVQTTRDLHGFSSVVKPNQPQTPGFLLFLPTLRGVRSAHILQKPPALYPETPDLWDGLSWQIDDQSVQPVWAGFERFFAWFKDREDVENEQRVAGRDFAIEDKQLRAVRTAVSRLVPGCTHLRVQRNPTPVLVATKSNTEFRVDQLSDGERNTMALAGEIARRLAIAFPNTENPNECQGIVLIDEIEQHLHPSWQREILPGLSRAFPNVQFIVTTHSPQVLSTAPLGSVVLFDRFHPHYFPDGVLGRDSNAILSDVFGVTARPEPQLMKVREIRNLIDKNRLVEASKELDDLATLLTEQDEQILGLRMRLHVATADQEAP